MIKEFYDIDSIHQDKEVIEDLIKQPELIPYKGILGGAMAFNDEKNVVINFGLIDRKGWCEHQNPKTGQKLQMGP